MSAPTNLPTPEPAPEPELGPARPPASTPASPLPTVLIVMGVFLALVVVLVVLLACGVVAYLAYEHPGLEAPLTIALSALAALGTVIAAVSGIVALLHRR